MSLLLLVKKLKVSMISFQAISRFQEFAGLEATGELDKETVDMMMTPRCGVKDFIDDDEDVDTPRIKVKSTLSRRKVCLENINIILTSVSRDMFCKDLGGE